MLLKLDDQHVLARVLVLETLNAPANHKNYMYEFLIILNVVQLGKKMFESTIRVVSLKMLGSL